LRLSAPGTRGRTQVISGCPARTSPPRGSRLQVRTEPSPDSSSVRLELFIGARDCQSLQARWPARHRVEPARSSGRRLPHTKNLSVSNYPPARPEDNYCLDSQSSVVVLESKVGDKVRAHDVAQSVLELHRLNEEVVLGIEAFARLRRLEIEAQPLLNADGAELGCAFG